MTGGMSLCRRGAGEDGEAGGEVHAVEEAREQQLGLLENPRQLRFS